MAKKKRRKPSYQEDEYEAQVKPVATIGCQLCGDVIEIGNMKDSFNCPSCGSTIKIN